MDALGCDRFNCSESGNFTELKMYLFQQAQYTVFICDVIIVYQALTFLINRIHLFLVPCNLVCSKNERQRNRESIVQQPNNFVATPQHKSVREEKQKKKKKTLVGCSLIIKHLSQSNNITYI